MKQFGPHLMIDASKCNQETLRDQDLVRRVLRELPEQLGMTIIYPPTVVEWTDKWATVPGYSGFVMIAESHISIHTFPDNDYVFMDIFSCRPFDIETAKKYLLAAFDAKQATVSLAKRGQGFVKSPHQIASAAMR
ncbi:MAG: adenosylmethionine decarboxylase [Nanoarchaeota archaeon]|nr:adenosylmethionine decarboxylase [Nanoarchaeota archaeon]